MTAAADIRVATPADFPGMHRVRMAVRENRLSDPGRVRPADYAAILDAGGRGWVAERNARIVGFAVADLARSNVWALFVDPGYEGRGLGRRLHDVMMDWFFDTGVDRVWLGTDPGTRAERFYRSAGWRYVGVDEENGEARYEISREEWMMNPLFEQRLSLVTLGVEDLEASTRFYRQVLGWTPSSIGAGQVTFFPLNGIVLGLFPRSELAADAGVDGLESGGLSRMALAHNVREREDVDRLLTAVGEAGARVVKPATDAPWGGRSGYFADPDGFLWEVAWNPGFPIRADGSIEVPA